MSDYYYVIQEFVKQLWGIQVKSKDNNNKDNIINISAYNENEDQTQWLYETLLERDIYTQWLNDLERNGLPGISKFHRVDIITTIIWTSSIVHASDHIGYGTIFKNFPMYASTIPFNGQGTWEDVLWNNKKANYEAFKTKTFLDFYVNYHYSFLKGISQDMITSPGLYNHFNHIPYYHKQLQLMKLHKDFLKKLHDMNQKWGWLLDVNTLSASTCF
jgi:hypothetical protein